MPRYKVIAPGFYDGKLYNPEGKRRVLNTDKPFTKKNPMPSWLADTPKESEAVRKKREAQETSQAEADSAKAEQDKEDIADASFLGDGETGSSVETI
ncbi:hypothetical protein KAT92_06670 [Candidatus Babeliales bacterium]|nr:hypothetical protein [Candidatus Babeliales bacterium]